MNLKEHLFNDVEGYLCQNPLFVDAEHQYHTKIYNIISYSDSQDKVASTTRIHSSKVQVASQRFASCKTTS